MTSPAQKQIIKTVCKLQGDSVRRIYERKELLINSSKDAYHQSLNVMRKELGIDDIDVLAEMSEICGEFDQLSVDCERLEDLSTHSLNIFNHILLSMGYLWKDIYPNAYNKLVQRIEYIRGGTWGLNTIQSLN